MTHWMVYQSLREPPCLIRLLHLNQLLLHRFCDLCVPRHFWSMHLQDHLQTGRKSADMDMRGM